MNQVLLPDYPLYDSQTKGQVKWEGEDEDFMTLLWEYVSAFSEKDTEDNPAFLDLFKYPIIKWHVSWPPDLGKYGIKNT